MPSPDDLAKIIWNYHLMHHELVKADCILALGSRDTRVAERAADLYLADWAPYILFSGGFGDTTKISFTKPEAEVFADVAVKKGVPLEKIIIENKSSNTGENIIFSKNLVEKKGYNFNSFILVQKPYMERRAYVTFKKQWPEKDCIVTSPQMTYEEYINDISSPIDKEKTINGLVGDLQRIKIYPEKGYSIEQEIPDSVWEAYEELIKLGYDKRLAKD